MRFTGAIHRPTPAHVVRLMDHVGVLAPAASADWFRHLPANGDPLGNDRYSNCVPVADFWSVAVRRAAAQGDQRRPTLDQVLDRFRQTGQWSGNPADPGQGTDVVDDLDNWCSHGILFDPQTEDVPVPTWIDPTQTDHLAYGVTRLGGILLTLNLPISAEDISSGWLTVGSGSDWIAGGLGPHRVYVGRLDADGTFWDRTWGEDIPISANYISTYALAAHAVVSRAWLDTTGLSPPGLDLTALLAQAESLKPTATA